MPILYYATRLSDNIAKTDEGFLLCRNAVIGRTGFQKYKGAELPSDQLKSLDYEVGDDEVIEVYRDAAEVFSPETIGSFEGKPVTDDHPPGQEFVDTSNVERLAKGHMQNVRKGDEPLENGDWPLLADLLITHPELINRVEAGDRELSCGYNYNLRRNKGQLCQVDIRGNHVAVVKRGRAGAEARINDSAETLIKEKKPVSNRILDLLGRGLKALAADANTTPEDLAASAAEVHRVTARATDSRKGEDRRTDDAHAHDNEVGNVGQGDQPGESRMTDKKKAKDEDPDRTRMHEALDRVLDARAEKAASDKQAADVDLEELKSLLGEFLTEEEGEEEHAADEGEVENAEVVHSEEGAHDTDPEEEEEEKEEAMDKGRAKDSKSVLVEPIRSDSRRGLDVASVLRSLRPMVAKSKDKALINAFNNISAQVNQRGRASSDGYRVFASGANRLTEEAKRGRAADADTVSGGDQSAKNNKMFEDRRAKYRN